MTVTHSVRLVWTCTDIAVHNGASPARMFDGRAEVLGWQPGCGFCAVSLEGPAAGDWCIEWHADGRAFDVRRSAHHLNAAAT